jgi:hypothetical protein
VAIAAEHTRAEADGEPAALERRAALTLRISRSRERSDRRDVNSWIGHVNAQIAGM